MPSDTLPLPADFSDFSADRRQRSNENADIPKDVRAVWIAGENEGQEADDVWLLGISMPRRAISTIRNVRRVT
jgi:hypothetical protein